MNHISCRAVLVECGFLSNPQEAEKLAQDDYQTKAALEHNYDITTSYDDYSVYDKFEQPLLDLGWDVIVFVPSKEEDSDRITCGNALISEV